MSRSSAYDYSDEEDLDIRVRRFQRAPSPARGAHYIQTVPAERPRGYYQAGPVYLQPERSGGTIITTHSRSRSRERRSSPPSHTQMAPVVIENKIINEHSSDDDSDYRRRHHSRSHASSIAVAREEWEMERARRELEELKIREARERDERRAIREARGDVELHRAKQELDDIKREQSRKESEKRLEKELELRRLEEEKKAADEKKRREKEAAEAVEHYKLKEAERQAKEKEEKERAEKEYKARLQADLLAAGVPEKDIAAIIEKKRIKKEEEQALARPTYTRMSLRHLDIETLIYYKIEFEYDQEPGYVLIKRWVPEWEQDMLWEHTRKIRVVEKKKSTKEEKLVLAIEDKKHHHHHHNLGEPEFEWVRKKERRRSKSPSLLMYLAGAKPA